MFSWGVCVKRRCESGKRSDAIFVMCVTLGGAAGLTPAGLARSRRHIVRTTVASRGGAIRGGGTAPALPLACSPTPYALAGGAIRK